MRTSIANLSDIEAWKSRMLHHVVEAFARPNQGDTQRNISVWRWSDALPFPYQDSIRVNGGCLSFEVGVGNESEVFFSVWYLAGEVRFGVRIPTALLGTNAMADRVRATSDKIAKAYDGSECARRVVGQDSVFFDWIFKDEGFASLDTAAKALRDDDVMLLIASRITDNLIHLYMAVMNILLDGSGMKVSVKQLCTSKDAHVVVVSVCGDTGAFEYWIKRRGSILKTFPQDNGTSLYRIEKTDSGNIAKTKYVIDGANFEILDVIPLQA